MFNSKSKNIFNDTPISYSDVSNKGLEGKIYSKDELGVQDYARALSEFVKECETPMTIGIQGDWGIGKTSLLNMIKAYLEGAKKSPYGMIWFNTWHYSLFGQDEFMGIAVIKGLLNQINNTFNIKDPENKYKEVAQKIGSVLKNARFSAFGFGVSAADAKTEDDSPDSLLDYQDISSVMLTFRDSFQELVNTIIKENNYDRLVFFIDDLDRVKPIKALELLESIKNFLDVENCVFLLAVDYEVVQIGMAQKLGQDLQKISGKSFFDKIIQLPFTMPSTSYDLGNYICMLLKKSGFKVDKDEFDFYEEVTSCTVGRNPRSIKRIINYAKLIRLIRKKHATKDTKDTEQQRKILYSLLCMQVAWPEIFSFFVKSPTPTTIKNIEDWDFLDKIPFINKLYDRSPNIDQLKSNISAFFDLLYDLLDENDDGHISQKELKPVLDILKVARLTTTTDFRQPTDIFFENLESNDVKKKFSRIKDCFKKSKWITSGKFEYRMSGKRYATIIQNRKQIGSLVTLKTNPFILRLDKDELLLEEYLKNDFEELLDIKHLIKPIDDESLTGFGDTMIDLEVLSKVEDKLIQKFFNRLFVCMKNETK
ncbi:MAG: hypothetical protein HOL09_08010 [Candidatus Marinimicrobia bacterium]|jgi:hypothetical protein|nr:hypothetical protein [Candidatus Neomarinimicrobiota bacterium]MBT3764006.1 hypothetical protein [Candidatus Neomarinimicrobiota bacterium]MBT4053889.1 hypothetical protein [Candidatus Neomarinimicrobiota bacterium]MBT4635729.1 hypothetical protein [Candidatus Neomarinimicrobiota bacterium]MBT5386829.1 hypothetical protein [Candidatus Neomarinimicrobiota bacterium]